MYFLKVYSIVFPKTCIANCEKYIPCNDRKKKMKGKYKL